MAAPLLQRSENLWIQLNFSAADGCQKAPLKSNSAVPTAISPSCHRPDQLSAVFIATDAGIALMSRWRGHRN
jgi:hypothetical protein